MPWWQKFAGGGVYGNEAFDLYGGVFVTDPNSKSGRFLVFSTTGDVVAPCLTNFNGLPSQGLNSEPIFVHDFQSNTTESISLTQAGQAFGNAFRTEDNRVSISGVSPIQRLIRLMWPIRMAKLTSICGIAS